MMMRSINLTLIILAAILVAVGGYAGYQEYSASNPQTKQEISKPSLTLTDDTTQRVPPSPTTALLPTHKTTNPPRVKILDTSLWTEYQCGGIAFKIPTNTYSYVCPDYAEGSKEVILSNKDGGYTGISIQIKTYNGGSRRQYRIQSMRAKPEEVTSYMRFQETTFGNISGLDVFESGGWWQGGYTSPIILAKGTMLVLIYGGRNFDDQTGNITRWDITDTIASTIRFL